MQCGSRRAGGKRENEERRKIVDVVEYRRLVSAGFPTEVQEDRSGLRLPEWPKGVCSTLYGLESETDHGKKTEKVVQRSARLNPAN
jgi:hypothetical protein